MHSASTLTTKEVTLWDFDFVTWSSAAVTPTDLFFMVCLQQSLDQVVVLGSFYWGVGCLVLPAVPNRWTLFDPAYFFEVGL